MTVGTQVEIVKVERRGALLEATPAAELVATTGAEDTGAVYE
jgi:hypothetical protein